MTAEGSGREDLMIGEAETGGFTGCGVRLIGGPGITGSGCGSSAAVNVK